MHWVIVQVQGGQLVSLAPLAGDVQVCVAPGVKAALRALAGGEMVAMPVANGQMEALLTALGRAGVTV